MVFVFKGNVRRLKLPEPFGVDLHGSVHQDLGDAIVLQQGLDGPVAQYIGDDLLEQIGALAAAQGDALLRQRRGEDPLQCAADLRGILGVDGRAQLGQQPALDALSDRGELPVALWAISLSSAARGLRGRTTISAEAYHILSAFPIVSRWDRTHPTRYC